MCKFRVGLTCALTVLLVGCGAEDVPAPEPTVEPVVLPLHEIKSSYTWEGFTVSAITPCCGFEVSGDELQIFPYYDGTNYIYLKKIVISNNNFWSTVISEYKGTDNFYSCADFDMVALDSGVTIAYKPVDENYSYVAVSSTLPSGYVKAAMQQLCQ